MLICIRMKKIISIFMFVALFGFSGAVFAMSYDSSAEDAGCNGTNLYNTITGQKCSNTISIQPLINPGCNGSNMYSTATGLKCANYIALASPTTCAQVVPALIVSYENTSSDGPLIGTNGNWQDLGRFVLHARCNLTINRIGIGNENILDPIFEEIGIFDGYGNTTSALPLLGGVNASNNGSSNPIVLTQPIQMTAGQTKMITVGGNLKLSMYNQTVGKKSKILMFIYDQHVTSTVDAVALSTYPPAFWNTSPYFTQRIIGWATPADEQIVK
jgi:hypothetical protein